MELEGFSPKSSESTSSDGPEDAIIGGGILGAGMGIVAAEGAESVLEAIICVVGFGVLGAGIPAAIWGGYKGTKIAWRLITADD